MYVKAHRFGYGKLPDLALNFASPAAGTQLAGNFPGIFREGEGKQLLIAIVGGGILFFF